MARKRKTEEIKQDLLVGSITPNEARQRLAEELQPGLPVVEPLPAPAPLPQPLCCHCAHYCAISEAHGVCRRFPPVPGHAGTFAVFPIVPANVNCGEHRFAPL